jgi:hypothetical protein
VWGEAPVWNIRLLNALSNSGSQPVAARGALEIFLRVRVKVTLKRRDIFITRINLFLNNFI